MAKEERGIKSLLAALGYERTGPGKPIPLPGGYAGLVEFGSHALVLCTDGVGSKVLLAEQLKRYDTVGIDCVAMNVNDAICVGAEPLAFVDYLAMQKPDEKLMAEIGKGLGAGAKEADVSIVGGETASLPELVNGFDLAGTCLAVVERERILTGAAIHEGDAILGVPSFGLHSNGFTLVRKVLQRARVTLRRRAPFAKATVGEVLLEPTRIYVKPALALLRSGLEVKGLAHVTGGGLQNLPRMNKAWQYRVEEPLAPQPVFGWLEKLGGVAAREMHRTFNMGMGLAVVCARRDADACLDVLGRELAKGRKPRVPENAGEGPRVVGRVAAGSGCLLAPLGEVYPSKT